MTTLVFDIETVPDVALGRRILGLDGLDDAAVAKAMFHHARQRTGSDFLPHEQHRVVAIACALWSRGELRIWSLGDLESPEPELIGRFYEGVERFVPELVSWNGGGFDLPVLHYRALAAGVVASRYWETGDADGSFRYNNYLNRFHWRHIDLMDVLAAGQMRARASLTDVAGLLGLPGKLGFSGARVWDTWLAGGLIDIRRYCETDVLTTLLIYLRFELMRGRYSQAEYADSVARVRRLLEDSVEPHFAAYREAWPRPE